MDHAEAHLRAYLQAIAMLPGGRLKQAGGVLWAMTGVGWPMFNGAIASPELGRCDVAAPMAVADLGAQGAPWFWWGLPGTPPELLAPVEKAGAFEFDHEAPWMEALIADLPEPTFPPGVGLVEVVDEAGLQVWARTLREVYQFPAAGEEAWTRAAALYEQGIRQPWRQWTAYVEGRPAGVTLLFCGGGVAGLFGIGTLPEFRRRGIGTLLTLAPLHASGMERAGFFATPLGSNVYRSLGFRTTGWVTRWLGGYADAGEVATARGAVGL